MSMFARSSITKAFAVFTATLALTLGAAADELATEVETVTAVWKVQAVELSFNSFDVAYTCGSLQQKIASILRPVVAQQVTRIGIRCSNPGMGTSATATILLASPAAATPETLHAMTTFDAHAQLVARVRSIDLPAEEDVPRFNANWRHVSMSRGKGLNLNSGDCDLLRSIRDQVLPHLAVKVTRSTRMCGTSTPVLEVEALLPIELPKPKLAKVE